MKKHIQTIALPIAGIGILIAIWTIAVTEFAVPDYILPKPLAVLSALRVGYIDGEFYPHFLFTLRSTLIGYMVGCTAAIALGALLSESRLFEQMFFPCFVALQSMPKVALAPLIIVWFGFGLSSKIVTVSLMCFFPIFINTIVGMRQANPALINMMRAFSSSRWLIFRRVKIWAAITHIFAGLQIAVVLSLIGAVVSEFIASTRGLGWLIQTASANFNTAQMFAALASLVAIGLTGTFIIRALHRRVVFWERAQPMTLSE
jgi:NitT/TauT family transport system permease protein